MKADYPPLGLREFAAICEHRLERPVGHHMVKQVLAGGPWPLHPPRRLPVPEPDLATG